jgi:hypothetical protein
MKSKPAALALSAAIGPCLSAVAMGAVWPTTTGSFGVPMASTDRNLMTVERFMSVPGRALNIKSALSPERPFCPAARVASKSLG